MNEKNKHTQGHKKTKARLQELFENEVFLKELEEIKAIPDEKQRSKKYWELTEKYSLEFGFGSPFVQFVMGEKPYLGAERQDVCNVIDENDELLYPEEGHPKYKPLPDKKLELYRYPIHLCISPLASKRDVLDFISKRWKEIRIMLDEYNDSPKLIKNKPKAERDNFIWIHRKLPVKEIAKLVETKFPDENLTYSDINSILHYLRKRKKSNLV